MLKMNDWFQICRRVPSISGSVLSKKQLLQQGSIKQKSSYRLQLNIKYQSNKTSQDRGDVASYGDCVASDSKEKTLKKLNKLLKLDPDEVVSGTFACIWNKLRGSIYITSRRVCFISVSTRSRVCFCAGGKYL